MDDGKVRYEKFWGECFINENVKLHDTIHRVALPKLTTKLEIKKRLAKKKDNYVTLWDNASIQRKLDIAQAKGENLEDILVFDSNILFDGDISKAEKAKLIEHIAALLPKDEILVDLKQIKSSCVVVDFMSLSRSNYKGSGSSNFKAFLDILLRSASLYTKTLLQFVFDSYVDSTIKDSERIWRNSEYSF